MTLVSLAGLVPWPDNFSQSNATPAANQDQNLTAVGHYNGFVTCAREAMTISHVGFMVGTPVGSPTVDVRIETVNAADGFPSGTLWSTTTNIVSGSIASTGWQLLALTSPAVIAAGQLFAVIVKLASGTSLQILKTSNVDVNVYTLPYQVFSIGTPTKQRSNGGMNMALGSSATTFYQLRQIMPSITATGAQFNNTSAAKRGLRFQVPFACRCAGLRWWGSSSIGDLNIGLYDDAGTELSSSSTTLDGDANAGSTSALWIMFFDNPVLLAKNTWYRATLEPTTATNISIGIWTLPSANYRSAYFGGGNLHYTTYTTGAWVDTNTNQLPIIDLLLDQLDDGATFPASRSYMGMN